MSGTRAPVRHRLCAGLFAMLPILGGDDAADQAVRTGNELYAAGEFAQALEQYAAAAELRPDAPEIDFNRGNAWFRQREYDQALEAYFAALATEAPELASRTRYNIGVAKLRQALGADTLSEASSYAQAAIRYFRDSLALDRAQDDARYNLELAYRYLRQVERRLLEDQRNDPTPGERTSLRRGQALPDRIRNEGSGLRQAMPELASRPHGERGNQAPENFSANEQQEQPRDARLPVAMSPHGAAELMERLLAEMSAAQSWLEEKKRAQLQAPGETRPW